jgi:hypothetical protein
LKRRRRRAVILFLLSVAALVRADPSLPPRVNIVPRPVAVELSAGIGLHRFRLGYLQAEGGATLRVSWAASEGELQLLSGNALFH